MHRDDYDNTLLHLHGEKSVVMIDPEVGTSHGDLLEALFTTPGTHAKLYQATRDLKGGSALFSAGTVGGVDGTFGGGNGKGDPRRIPRLHVSLTPGDLLYIPKGWLHDVESQTPTVSAALRFEVGTRLSPEVIHQSAMS